MEDDALLDAARTAFPHSFAGVIKLSLLHEKLAIWVDGRQAPPAVGITPPSGVEGAFCELLFSRDDAGLVLSPAPGRLEAQYVAGRVKISGDMAVMIRREEASLA